MVLADPRRLFWILHARNISIPGIELRLQSAIIQPAAECNNRSSSVCRCSYPCIGMRATRKIVYTRSRDTWDVRLYSLLRDRVQLYSISCHEGMIGETRINTRLGCSIESRWHGSDFLKMRPVPGSAIIGVTSADNFCHFERQLGYIRRKYERIGAAD